MALQLCLRRSSGLLGGVTTASSPKLFSTIRSTVGPSAIVSSTFQNGTNSVFAPQQLTMSSPLAASFQQPQWVTKRWSSTAPMDLGDVIGIDLGTTNSCVCIMVGNLMLRSVESLKEKPWLR
jgi:hypothetical protein